jgi:RNA polymerase sigma-B factor
VTSAAGIPSPRSATSAERSARALALFQQMAAAEPGSADHERARTTLIESHLPLARSLAGRFRDRGEPYEDLVQVGTEGLIKAVDRFDPERGVDFASYATPTVIGEIKRHFRDRGWAIRVPRRLQERRMAVSAATSRLQQDLGRSPTVAELAASLTLTEEDVLEALEAADAYSTLSFDASRGDDDDALPALGARLGVHDPSLEEVEQRESLRPALERLPERERQVVLLRFYGNRTQSQIGEELGMSQMHVSRLLARALASMRGEFADS